ncbi:MAG: XdhC family protein [Sulfolobales archaeon]
MGSVDLEDVVLVSTIMGYLKKGMKVALCEVVYKEGSAPRDVGAKIVVGEDGLKVGTIGGGLFESELVSDALKAIAEGRSRLVKYSFTGKAVEGAKDTGLLCGGVLWVFIDVFAPPQRALVIGLGNVGRPLSHILKLMGFEVHALDTDKETERIAGDLGLSSVFVGTIEGIASRIREITKRGDQVFVVYGDVHADYVFVKESLKTEASTIWLLGSRRKVAEFVKKLISEGFSSEDLIRRLRAPIGIDIGADTPEEVAISVAAELVALRRGANARSLNAVPQLVAELTRSST